MDQKIQAIQDKLSQHNATYVIISDSIIDIVYELFVHNTEKETNWIETLNNDIVYLYYGLYHNIINSDTKLSIFYYQKAATMGNDCAMYNMAMHYERCDDHDNVELYLKNAAAKGNARAAWKLGHFHTKIRPNNELAKKYYRQAIKANDINALNDLTRFYYREGDYINAKKYAEISAGKNNPIGIVNLAILYQDEKNIVEAKKCYELAISMRNTAAMVKLALIYESEKNYETAIIHYIEAIHLNNNVAMNNLAHIYHANKDLKDHVLAEKYYLQAYENKNYTAVYNLARFYRDERHDSKSCRTYSLKLISEFLLNNDIIRFINTLLKEQFDIELAAAIAEPFASHFDCSNKNMFNIEMLGILL